MKVVYPVCCGVDVHKTFPVATIIKTTGSIEPSYSKKRFLNALTVCNVALDAVVSDSSAFRHPPSRTI